MAHPTRTGDVVAFAYPPYQFDAATPGTLVARSAFFGQHGYVPDVQDLPSNTNMRATFLAGGKASNAASSRTCAASTSRRRPRSCSTSRCRSRARVMVLLDLLDKGHRYTPVSGRRAHRLPRPTRSDDHDIDGTRHLCRRRVAARDDVRRGGRAASRPDRAAGVGRQRRRVTAELGVPRRHAGDRCRERVGTRCHQLRQPRVRLRRRPVCWLQQARANFPFLAANIVDDGHRRTTDWVKTSTVFEVNGVKVGVIGADVKNTPELVKARPRPA